jgi:RNA polymerase sigma factor (sigma-70 family)
MEITERVPRTYTTGELTELLRQAQQGSHEALEELFSFLRERIFAIAKQNAWNLGLRLADAEEATQEALLVVHEHLQQLATWENVMKFARQVVRNRLGNYHQYRLYRDPVEVPMEKARVSVRMEPQLHLEAAELERLIERALSELHRKHPRHALIFRGLLAGLNKEELCQILGLKPSHFDVVLHRGRRLLRRLLKEKYGVEV